jgi:hypothetical protein
MSCYVRSDPSVQPDSVNLSSIESWKLPSYQGIEDFKGVIRHASNWDPTFDVSGKRVAVIALGIGNDCRAVESPIKSVAIHVLLRT